MKRHTCNEIFTGAMLASLASGWLLAQAHAESPRRVLGGAEAEPAWQIEQVSFHRPPDSVLRLCETKAGEQVHRRAAGVESIVLGSGFVSLQSPWDRAPQISIYESFRYLLMLRYDWIELDLSDTSRRDTPYFRIRVAERTGASNCWTGLDPSQYLRELPASRCVVVEPISRLTSRYRYDALKQRIEDEAGVVRWYEHRISDTVTGDVLYRYANFFWDAKGAIYDRLNPKRHPRGVGVYVCSPHQSQDPTDILVPNRTQ